MCNLGLEKVHFEHDYQWFLFFLCCYCIVQCTLLYSIVSIVLFTHAMLQHCVVSIGSIACLSHRWPVRSYFCSRALTPYIITLIMWQIILSIFLINPSIILINEIKSGHISAGEHLSLILLHFSSTPFLVVSCEIFSSE